jgi:hypothetical protein
MRRPRGHSPLCRCMCARRHCRRDSGRRVAPLGEPHSKRTLHRDSRDSYLLLAPMFVWCSLVSALPPCHTCTCVCAHTHTDNTHIRTCAHTHTHTHTPQLPCAGSNGLMPCRFAALLATWLVQPFKALLCSAGLAVSNAQCHCACLCSVAKRVWHLSDVDCVFLQVVILYTYNFVQLHHTSDEVAIQVCCPAAPQGGTTGAGSNAHIFDRQCCAYCPGHGRFCDTTPCQLTDSRWHEGSARCSSVPSRNVSPPTSALPHVQAVAILNAARTVRVAQLSQVSPCHDCRHLHTHHKPCRYRLNVSALCVRG